VEAGISGNGIGLAVVRELVVAQGGTVAVHDAPGGGASFVVTLRPGSAPAPDQEAARASVRSSFTTPPSAHSLLQ